MTGKDCSEIIENLKVICLCRNIKRGTIVRAVREGSTTVEEIKGKLGTGNGDCKGERCLEKVREIIKDVTGGV